MQRGKSPGSPEVANLLPLLDCAAASTSGCEPLLRGLKRGQWTALDVKELTFPIVKRIKEYEDKKEISATAPRSTIDADLSEPQHRGSTSAPAEPSVDNVPAVPQPCNLDEEDPNMLSLHSLGAGTSGAARPDAAATSASWEPAVPGIFPTNGHRLEVPVSRSASSATPQHGYICVCGRGRALEDAVTAAPSFVTVGQQRHAPDSPSSGPVNFLDLHFFGVYDGHGGPEAATHCAHRLHVVLAQELLAAMAEDRNSSVPQDTNGHIMSALKLAYHKVDAEVAASCTCARVLPGDSCTCVVVAGESVGSTALAAVLTTRHTVVANCGDSRAVLCRRGTAIPLSSDHKPERLDELQRIEASGGKVLYYNGYRVGGLLAMSRAIGDRFLKPFIIPDPEFTCIPRETGDEFLILATDGLWDVVSSERACEVVSRCFAACRQQELASPERNIQGPRPSASCTRMAAAVLAKLAIARGSTDDITAVVVDLRSA